MKNKKLYILITLMFMMISVFMIYGQADNSNVQKLKKEQQALKKKIQQTQRAIREKKSATKNVTKEIQQLDMKLTQAVQELETIESHMAALEKQIGLTKNDLSKAQTKLEKTRAIADKRIRVMYEEGFIGYLDVLLESENFGDFITRFDTIKLIVNSDNAVIEEMAYHKKQVDDKANKLQAEQKKKAALLVKVDESKKCAETAKTNKEEVLKDLKNDLKELERQEDNLLAESNELENKLVSLLSNNKYSGGKMAWPVPGYTKFSKYGMRMHPILKKKKMHTGIDIGCPSGSKIVAVNDGTVIFAGEKGGYGNAVIIDHGGKIATLYGHNTKLLVKKGDKVKKGEAIAKAGSTGLSTCPHCHFEVRVNGKPVNPAPYLGR